MDPRQVIDVFRERGLLNEAQADEFFQYAVEHHQSIEKTLIESGLVDEAGFVQVIAESLGAELIDLSALEPDAGTLALIPAGLVKLHGAFPVAASGNTIFTALVDPFNSRTIEDLRFALGREIVPVVGFPARVRELIHQYYKSGNKEIDQVLGEFGGDLVVEEREDELEFNLQAVAAEANAAPVVKYVDLILDKAIAAKASDIHFEPFEHEFKIRYRVDGALYEMDPHHTVWRCQ
jgi:type IV pilus assembly protein PilB